jgi:hypothetical protein
VQAKYDARRTLMDALRTGTCISCPRTVAAKVEIDTQPAR